MKKRLLGSGLLAGIAIKIMMTLLLGVRPHAIQIMLIGLALMAALGLIVWGRIECHEL